MSNITVATPRAPTRKRDQKIRRAVRRLATIGNLTDLRYRPALQATARLSILLDTAYEHLKARESLLDENDELSSSLDTYRRLSDSFLAALKSLGLTPTSVLPDGDRSLDAVFERIGKAKRAREKEPDGPATPSPS